MPKIELLAPAGSREAFLAAVQNGADAVYLGGRNFGARAFADNFSEEDIAEVIRYAHLRGVKVYITVNTIVFEEEWDEMSSYIDFLYQSGCDALIVQDLGVLKFIKEKYPDFGINASTQMNIHNVEGAKLLSMLGVKRVVLGREVPLEMVRKIHEATDIELEVFAHGALCFSYSGNCLMSSFIGKRSGNRGRCAQPCRLPYQLVRDEKVVNETAYLLSTKDLLTLDHLPEIIDSGVTSIKIEGRMKKPEYVASVVSKYREAIDRYYEKKPYVLSAAALKDLKKVFNREFTKGYLFGETNANITNIRTPNHQGIEIGEVARRSDEAVYIRLCDDLSVGDGIRIRSEHEAGLTVTKMFVNGNAAEHAAAGSTVMIYLDNQVSPKDKVLKTSDYQQTKDLVSSITSDARKVMIDGVFTARLGEKPELTVMAGGFEVSAIGDEPVENAQKAPMREDMIRKQLNKLGDTPFVFDHLELRCDEDLFINIRDLNEVRRKAVAILGEKLSSEVKRVDLPIRYEHLRNPQPAYQGPARIVAFVDNREAMEAALEAGCEEVVFQGSDHNLPDNVIPAFNRVVTSYPEDLPPKVFINENGGLMLPTEVIVGPYCNIVNTRSLSLLARLGIREVYLSPEMSKARMKGLMNSISEMTLGMVVYGRLDMMISKHCVIAKNLHNDAKFCRMCHLHHYELIDRLGNALPIIGDSQCNMRILNPKRLNLIDYVGEMADMGIKKLAMIFTTESKEEIMEAIKAFTKALAKEKTDFRDVNDTYGHYLKGIE